MFERIRTRLKSTGAPLAEVFEEDDTEATDIPYAAPAATQRCADRAYVRQLKDRLREPHIKPLNDLVDELRQDHSDQVVPYIAPTYGGTQARLPSVFQSPGYNALNASSGSGVI